MGSWERGEEKGMSERGWVIEMGGTKKIGSVFFSGLSFSSFLLLSLILLYEACLLIVLCVGAGGVFIALGGECVVRELWE